MNEKTDIVKQIILDYDQSLEIKTISRPKDGYSNSVYFITFTNDLHLELVLKFIKANDNTEVMFYQLLHENNVENFLVPKILKFDSTIRNYYISSKLSGFPLSHSWDSMTHEQRLKIYRELGRFVGQLHSKYTYEKCGYLKNQEFYCWKEMFCTIIEKQIEKFKGTIFEELGMKIYKYLFENIHLIDYEIVPRLLHIDLHCGNILILNDTVTGILDAEDAVIGHNEYELMRIEKGHFEGNETDDYRKEFLSIYTTYVKLDDDYDKRRRFYSLSRELVAIQCLIDFGEQYVQNSSIEQEMKIIEEKIQHIVHFDKK
ncbi:hypothetical protein I4U23_004238 [Adineta vaga]|nr:hypothetical protein I4U23_004238 [Adineta vaga]